MKKDIILVSVISFLVTGIMAITAYNFMPYEIYSLGDDMLGASITVINGSDKIKDSRAVINTNFANLNADKLEISDFNATTSLPQITTLSNLSTVGTVGTGSWQADVISVSYGGTGASSLTNNLVLLGNNTSAIKTVSAGSNGQTLTLVAGVPTWQSGTTDLTGDYDWTGHHSWTTGTTTFNSEATFNGNVVIASTTIAKGDVGYPTASSSIASKGYVDSIGQTYKKDLTGTDFDNSSSEQTVAQFQVNANDLEEEMVVRVFITDLDIANPYQLTLRAKYGATTLATLSLTTSATLSNMEGYLEFHLFNNGSSAQKGFMNVKAVKDYVGNSNSSAMSAFIGSSNGTSAIDSTTNQNITITAQFSSSQATNGLQTFGYTATNLK